MSQWIFRYFSVLKFQFEIQLLHFILYELEEFYAVCDLVGEISCTSDGRQEIRLSAVIQTVEVTVPNCNNGSSFVQS